MEGRESVLSKEPGVARPRVSRTENLLLADFIIANQSMLWQGNRKDQLDKTVYEAVLFNFGLFALLSLPRSTSLKGSFSPVLGLRPGILWGRLGLRKSEKMVRVFKVATSPQIPDLVMTLPGLACQHGLQG
jgi:hypothetical protein